MAGLSKYTELYILEVEENIEKLNSGLIDLESKIKKNSDDTSKRIVLTELMRASHTIKGSSAAMGFVKTAYMTHVMEDVFDGLIRHTLNIDQEIINSVFGLIDNLIKSTDEVKKNGQELDFSEDVEKLKKITGINTIGIGKSARADKPQSGNQPSEKDKGQEIKTPDSEQADTQKKSAMEKEKEVQGIIKQQFESVAKIDHIKVPVERLDTILELVEELLIDRMKLEQFSLKNPELKQIYNHINLITSSMQYQVMQSRLIPVEQVFNRFPRMIRDLGQKLGKEIELNISGGDIELDRTIVDKLGEPLVHLLRNAIDHGIDKKGSINVEAYRKNNYVNISVENVGRGLEIDKIKRIAIAKGFADANKIDSMAESAIINFIFEPSFSTKEAITEISGRGVGLGVVKNFADALSGRVIVESQPNRVKFIMELPLTLAIINTLLVEVDESIFAVPLPCIERSVIVPKSDIKMMADNEVAVVDGIKVPIVRLKNIFNLEKCLLDKQTFMSQRKGMKFIEKTGELNVESREDSLLVVLVKKVDEIIGLVVDNLLSEQEIIVKPLSSVLRNIKGFSGSTILGDGSTILILDVANLIN